MTVEHAQMMWLKPPAHCYNNLTSKLRSVVRSKGAKALADELATLCDEYWVIYCDVHDRKGELQSAVQAWYIFQAIRKILIEYGWWDKKNNVPQNWYTQEGGDEPI